MRAEQIVGDAVHHLLDVAEHIRVQAAEIGDAGGGAHAAEEAVALEEQRLAALAGGGGGGGDAGGPAAEDDDLVVAADRRLTCRLGEKERVRPLRVVPRRGRGLHWPPLSSTAAASVWAIARD